MADPGSPGWTAPRGAAHRHILGPRRASRPGGRAAPDGAV